jgi:cytochrome c biogenesis protein CcmG, thiol:disulfide interchange protein DsbE
VRRVPQALAVAVVFGLLGLLIWDLAHSSGSKVLQAVDAGKTIPAPAFVRPRIDTSGTLSLASLRGRVVVMNFWASWCIPCKGEARILEAGSRNWTGRGVVFVGVNEQDLRGPARAFMKRYGITYPVITDDGPMIGHYGVTGFPETFFVDRRGRVVPPHVTGVVTTASLDQAIRRALKT